MKYNNILKDFTAAISNLSNRKDLRDNFIEFLDYTLFFFCENPTEKQIESFNSKNERFDLFKKAMLLLGDGSEDFTDILGEFFMCNVTMGRNGQYFTPEVICELMAKMVSGDDDEKRLSIDDCCCGSGRMLLAHAKNSKHPHNKTYYANDIDIICSKMCLINLLLNSLSGVVTCGNGLIPIWREGRETFIVSTKRIDLGEKGLFYPQYRYYSAEESKTLFIEPEEFKKKKETFTQEQITFTEKVQPIGSGEQLSLF